MKTHKLSFYIILIAAFLIILSVFVHRYRIITLNEYEVCNDSLKELLTEYTEHEKHSPLRKHFTISIYQMMTAGANYVRILPYPSYDTYIEKISSGYIRLNNTTIIIRKNHLQGDAGLSLMRLRNKRPFVVFSGKRKGTTRAEEYFYNNAESSFFKCINGQWRKSDIYDTLFEEENRQQANIDSLKYVFPIEPDFVEKYGVTHVYESSAFIADWLEWSRKIKASATYTKVNDLCKAVYQMYHKDTCADNETKLILSLIEVRKYSSTFEDFRQAYIEDYFFNTDFISQATERYYVVPYFDVGKDVLYMLPHGLPRKVAETLNYKYNHRVFSILFFVDGALIATDTDSVEDTMEYVNYDAIFFPNKAKMTAHEIGGYKIHFDYEYL